jgi:beta-glucanase (GH16 family)
MDMFRNAYTDLRTVAIVALVLLMRMTGPAHAAPPPGYTLSWSEEFHQGVNAMPNSSVWTYDTGGGGWGNRELEIYVDDRQHAHIVSDPAATDGQALQVQATTDGQGHYYSARIKTRTKVTVQYGYIEARIKLPYGQGIWPAFWMLGSSIDSARWPSCGEIDIMENIGREPSINHGSLHGPGYSGGSDLTGEYTLPKGKQFKDAYHTFGLLWSPNSVTFSVDGHAYETHTSAEVGTWVFNRPFFFLLNIAVGGSWPGNPDGSTVFPQTMLVDYIRVYKQNLPNKHTHRARSSARAARRSGAAGLRFRTG